MGASNVHNLISRVRAKPSFTKINFAGGRLQGLFGNFSLMLTANSQYATNRMYAYEQIGYGGLPFGNAYDPSEIIADSGIEGKMELRCDGQFLTEKLPSQYFVYYDGVRLWNYDHINATLELDKPLVRKVAALAAELHPGERGLFNLCSPGLN